MKSTDELYQESIEKIEEAEAKSLGLTIEEYREQKAIEEAEEQEEKRRQEEIEAEAEEIRRQEEEAENKQADEEAEEFEMRTQFMNFGFNL